MGWWKQSAEGHSFAEDNELSWGDGPADIMGPALDRIFAEFKAKYGRKPTVEELQAGVMFSARPMLVEEVAEVSIST